MSGPRGSLAPRFQSSGDSSTCVRSILPSSFVLPSSVPIHGLTQLGLRSYPSGSFVPETVSFLRSDRPVYPTASVRPFGLWQPTAAVAGPVFSYLRNPYPSVSGAVYDFCGCLHSGVGRLHEGFPNFRYLDTSGPLAPHQLLGTQGGRGCPPTSLGSSAPGPPGLDCYGQFDSSFIYQQARRDIVVRARHIPGCLNVIADHLSRQPISTEWSLHPEIMSWIFGFWGTPVVDMFATLSNSRLPQFMSPIPEPRALARLAGKVDVHVSTFSLAQQSYSETTVYTGGRSNSDSPLVAETGVVPTPTSSMCGSSTILSISPRYPVSTGPEIHLGRKVIPSACMEALVRHYKAAGFSDEVSRLAAAPR